MVRHPVGRSTVASGLFAVALGLDLVVVDAARIAGATIDPIALVVYQVTLVGTVKEFRWQNPHTWIEVEVPDEKDKSKLVVWGVELTSPTYLVRAGWKSNIIKPGDKVTVVVNPVRSGEPSGIFVSMTLADGRELFERPARLGTPDSK